MDFNFSFQNIIDNDGISLSLTGMAIVFTGLTIISLFIAALPKVLNFLDNLVAGKKDEPQSMQTATVADGSDDDDMACAIGLAIHLEMENRKLGGKQKITISQAQDQRNFWDTAGKMRTLARRR
ncbi:MAG: OadG family protein [Planctomycetes bacterium]|nr:OadG family protein [Planctomycetota bacterium]